MTEFEKLREVGLTEYETRAYLTLLRNGIQTGREVAAKSKVPPTRVFDALHSLVDKGLVSRIKEKPMLFKAIKPEIGLKDLFERKLEQIKKIEFESIKTLKEIKKEQKIKPMIHEKLEVVLGFEKMYSYFVKMTTRAKKEVHIFSVGEEIPYSVKLVAKKLIARGLIPKLIVTKCDSENKHILRERIKEGWDLKYYLGVGDFTFSVIDKKLSMINVRNPDKKEERISIFFEIPGIAKALADYFDSIWKLAKPI